MLNIEKINYFTGKDGNQGAPRGFNIEIEFLMVGVLRIGEPLKSSGVNWERIADSMAMSGRTGTVSSFPFCIESV